jgi:tryptophan synthase alpha chain
MNPFRKTKKQVSIFITAGYPDINALPGQIEMLEDLGVDFIEIGIPFSDPLADGPTIQASSDAALKNGMNIPVLFNQLKGIQSKIPLIIMTYFNPIIHFGLEPFLEECKSVGITHLIIPDISLEIYERRYHHIFQQHGITLCFLITPNTDSKRIQKMSEYSSEGFIYLVSSTMTTGNAVQQIAEPEAKRIRMACGTTPVMIGFGIRSRADVDAVFEVADGAIIGSAYMRSIADGSSREFINSILASEPQSL